MKRKNGRERERKRAQQESCSCQRSERGWERICPGDEEIKNVMNGRGIGVEERGWQRGQISNSSE